MLSALCVHDRARLLLDFLMNEPTLSKLNGVELIAVLNSAVGTVNAAVGAAALAENLKKMLAE